jgi:GPH family glycoside/pentoside/hexuronide:cation symporter
MKANGLSLKTKLGFGVCDIGGNLFVTIMGFYVFDFIKDVALLGAALAGTVLFAGKIWDAIIDPAIGFFSDRTKSRHGRRRPWMLGGAIAVVFFMILMYTNPHIESQFWLAVWVIIVYCLLVTAYSVINIPYGALTPELTRNYDEQTSLNAYRMSFAVVGTFIGVGGLFIVDMFANKDLGPMIMGGAMGLVICATALITYFTIKEPARAVAEASEQQGFLKTYAAAFRNRPFVLVLIAYGMHMAATAMLQSILRDYFQYIFGDEQSSKYALMPFLVMALVFIPIWTAISKRIGKKWAYNIGMSIFGIVLLLVFFFASTRGPMFMYVLMGIAGIGYSTNYVMPYAIIPDTVERGSLLRIVEPRESVRRGPRSGHQWLGSRRPRLRAKCRANTPGKVGHSPAPGTHCGGVRRGRCCPCLFLPHHTEVLRRAHSAEAGRKGQGRRVGCRAEGEGERSEAASENYRAMMVIARRRISGKPDSRPKPCRLS